MKRGRRWGRSNGALRKGRKPRSAERESANERASEQANKQEQASARGRGSVLIIISAATATTAAAARPGDERQQDHHHYDYYDDDYYHYEQQQPHRKHRTWQKVEHDQWAGRGGAVSGQDGSGWARMGMEGHVGHVGPCVFWKTPAANWGLAACGRF